MYHSFIVFILLITTTTATTVIKLFRISGLANTSVELPVEENKNNINTIAWYRLKGSREEEILFYARPAGLISYKNEFESSKHEFNFMTYGLIIHNLSFSDQWFYVYHYQNTENYEHSWSQRIGLYPFDIQIGGLGNSIEVNRRVEIRCTVRHRYPYKLEKWIMIGDQKINASQENEETSGSILDLTRTLTYTIDYTLRKEDNARSALCVIKEPFISPPELKNGQLLNVLYPPSGVPLVTSQSDGMMVTLTCGMHDVGNPRAVSVWYRYGVRVTLASVTQTTDYAIRLRTSNVTIGNYTCVMRNRFGETVTSKPLSVTMAMLESKTSRWGVTAALIGGACAGVLLLVAAVVTVLLLRRRGTVCGQKPEKELSSNHGVENIQSTYLNKGDVYDHIYSEIQEPRNIEYTALELQHNHI